jgi:Asp-tRNA(Asn)/Glu-tRNA(Gln) amidotransferase A subunit family amidase
MALSWTMDKIGPMCRSVEDCALVFNAIYGPDGRDDSVIDAPFEWHPDIPLSKLRIGYVKTEFEPQLPDGRGGGRGDAGGRGRGGLTPEQQRAQEEGRLKILNEVLDVYRKAGAAIQPIDVPGLDITAALNFILSVEAAAAFDDLTRSKDIGDKSLNTWPNTFRTSRYVPAVEYIRAQRARAVVIREMEKLMSQYDAFISPTSSRSLSLTNLTGHPAIALRAGFLEDSPVDFMITGRLYDEGTLMRVALAHEQATKWHERIPNLY